MARVKIYACTKCNRVTQREYLVVKKVVFLSMGIGGRTLRSRVTDWLCPDCRLKDDDYSLPAFSMPVPTGPEKIEELTPRHG